MLEYYEQIQKAAAYIRARIPETPGIGMTLGSGWGALMSGLEDAIHIPYRDVPCMRVSTVAGHAGEWVFGRLGNKYIAIMSGRLHYYEGFAMEEIALPIRVMQALGCETVILTNASGAINPAFRAGELMLINDHINLNSHNPLIGPNDDRLGPRFFDMSHAYDPELIRLARAIAQEQDFPICEGVYAYMTGPSFETPAEIRYLRAVGADAVGMSTVPETLIARHAGMRVLGLSCLTNMAAGVTEQPLSHAEVLETSARVQPYYTRFLIELLRRI